MAEERIIISSIQKYVIKNTQINIIPNKKVKKTSSWSEDCIIYLWNSKRFIFSNYIIQFLNEIANNYFS